MSSNNRIGPIPHQLGRSIESILRTMQVNSSDFASRVRRLAEMAYAEGYDDGHRRGVDEGYADAERRLEIESAPAASTPNPEGSDR